MPLFLLLALFVVVPLVELYVIIQVGQQIGALPTIAILIADSILGWVLMRSQGRKAWLRFQEALGAGRVPAREVLDGVLVIFGGALLLTPGFVTDIFGIVLLLPPTRAVLRRILGRRVTFGMIGGTAGPRRPGGPRARTSYDVDGHATDVDPRRLP